MNRKFGHFEVVVLSDVAYDDMVVEVMSGDVQLLRLDAEDGLDSICVEVLGGPPSKRHHLDDFLAAMDCASALLRERSLKTSSNIEVIED
jgi:hypothetical protein